MKKLRKYGKPPFHVAVIHGGPGARGEMAPVARELASFCSVLEPLQTARSLLGQVEELKTVLKESGDPPVTLIGFSWGAWLSFMVAAHYPAFVKKLILVGSGPYEEQYAAKIGETRLNRLSEEDKAKANAAIEILNNPTAEHKDTSFAEFGALCEKADAYDPVPWASTESGIVDFQDAIFQGVWRDAVELRRSGKLLELGAHIGCPVVAIHGDYDPHPAEGVRSPLSMVLKRFRFVPVKNCGHKPWMERHGRDKFYRILKEELRECIPGSPQ